MGTSDTGSFSGRHTRTSCGSSGCASSYTFARIADTLASPVSTVYLLRLAASEIHTRVLQTKKRAILEYFFTPETP